MSNNRYDELDTAIRNYYGSQGLSDDTLDGILRGAAPREPEPTVTLATTPRARAWSRRQWLQAAAVGTVFVLGGATVQWQVSRRGTREMLLDELVLNHRGALRLDVAADSFEVVQNALSRLSFEIRAPQHLVAGYELLGGRYCSLLGNLAVQLKFHDPASARIDTLFLTPLTAKLEALNEQHARVEGIAIATGAHDGLFYGHTRQIEP